MSFPYPPHHHHNAILSQCRWPFASPHYPPDTNFSIVQRGIVVSSIFGLNVDPAFGAASFPCGRIHHLRRRQNMAFPPKLYTSPLVSRFEFLALRRPKKTKPKKNSSVQKNKWKKQNISLWTCIMHHLVLTFSPHFLSVPWKSLCSFSRLHL